MSRWKLHAKSRFLASLGMTAKRGWQLERVLQRPLLATGLIVCACLLLAGCPREATIGEVLDDPGRFNNKDVAIRGTVTNSFGVLGRGAYELDDGTGKMWVVVEQGGGVPSKGARVRSVGRIVNGFTFSGRNLGTALREKGHKLDR